MDAIVKSLKKPLRRAKTFGARDKQRGGSTATVAPVEPEFAYPMAIPAHRSNPRADLQLTESENWGSKPKVTRMLVGDADTDVIMRRQSTDAKSIGVLRMQRSKTILGAMFTRKKISSPESQRRPLAQAPSTSASPVYEQLLPPVSPSLSSASRNMSPVARFRRSFIDPIRRSRKDKAANKGRSVEGSNASISSQADVAPLEGGSIAVVVVDDDEEANSVEQRRKKFEGLRIMGSNWQLSKEKCQLNNNGVRASIVSKQNDPLDVKAKRRSSLPDDLSAIYTTLTTFNLKSSVGGSTPVVLIKLPAKEGSRAPKAIAENTDISSSKPINSSQKKTIKNILQKFLQRRPTENVLLDKGIMKHNLFGNTLEDICKDLGSNGALQVPPMIPALIACIERNVNSLGLYRASGNIAHIQKLRLELEKAPTTAHITQAVQSFHNDVDVLTGALKLFFRELRKPLLSLEFRNGVIDIRDRNLSLDAQYEQISALVEALEPYNRDVLLVMLRHLLYVTQHIEQNQMSIDGMAIVWGPSLFSTGNCGQTAMLQCITDNNSALNFVMKVFDASTQFEIYPYKESGQRLHLQSERSKDLQVNEGRIRMLIKHIEESDVVHKKDIYSTKRSLDKAEKKVWALLTGEKDLRVLVNSKEGVYAMAQILQECVKKQNLIPKAVRDLDLQSDISDRDYAITREAILRMSQTEQELLDLVLAHLLRLKEEHAYIYEKSIVDNWSPVLFPEHRKLFGHMDHMLEYRRYMKNSVIRNEYASSHSLQSASNSVRQSETNHGFLESDTVELRKQPTLDGVGSYRPMRRSSEERKKNRHS